MAKGDVIFAFGGAFLVGILTASVGNLWWMAVAASAIFLLSTWKWNFIFGILLTLSAGLGFFYFFLFTNLTRPEINAGDKFRASITEEPKVFEKYQRIIVERNGKEFEIITGTENIFNFGDEVEIQIESAEGRTAVFPKIEFLKNEDNSLKGKLIGFRHFVIGKYKSYLSTESSALLSGIMLGYKSDFSRDFKDKLSKSGTSHIVALSGYNIAVLVLAISYFLLPLAGRRRTFFLTAIFIVLFTIMVGGEASIVRAAIMGFLIILAKETGRIYSLRNAIILAAFLMVLFDPQILVFDLGFQLSFLSLLGIVYLSPLMSIGIKKAVRFDGLRENIANTVSAQIMVSPLILGTFGQISILGVLANVLILSFVPLTMFLGFILFIFSLISSGLAEIISWLLEFILRYMLFVIELFSNLSFGPQTSLGFAYAAMYYLLVFWTMYNFKKHESC